jgi:Galactose oxidase, central domain/Kelch motif
MAERDRFEFDLAAALRAYLEDAPTEVRPTELARQFAAAYPHRRSALGRWGFELTPAMAWVLLLAGLLLALVLGGLVAGAWQADHAVVIAPPAMFSRTGSMATTRVGHTATLLHDGRVLVAGGNDGYGAFVSAEIYDPKTGTFSPTGPLTTARNNHTATLLADGRVLVTGGSSFTDPLASAEIYDLKTGTFSPTGAMTTAREYHTATLLADGRVLVTGSGAEASGASAEIYDPATGTFSPTVSMNTARLHYTATLLADGRVLIAGDSSDGSADIFVP